MKTITHRSQYGGTYELILSFRKYGNGQTRLDLIDSKDGLPYATTTVASGVSVSDDEVIIKNYSENEGILDSLIKAGVVSHPLYYIPSGFVNLSVCKLLIKNE